MKIYLESRFVVLYICGMETKSVRVSKYYHNEIRRYLADKGYDGENISSIINASIFHFLTKRNHVFTPKDKISSKIKSGKK